MGYGFVYKTWWLVGIGAFVLMFGITAWAVEPGTAEDDEMSTAVVPA